VLAVFVDFDRRAELLAEATAGGGERLGHFGGPERTEAPQVDGGNNAARPQKLVEFTCR